MPVPPDFSPREGEQDAAYVARITEMDVPDRKTRMLHHYAWRTAMVIARAIQADFYSLSDRGTTSDNPIVAGCNEMIDSIATIEHEISRGNFEFRVYKELYDSTKFIWSDLKQALGFRNDATEQATVEDVAEAAGEASHGAFVLELGYLRHETKNQRRRDETWQKVQAFHSSGEIRGRG